MNEITERLQKIGVPITDGSGTDAIEYATRTLGIPLYEILAVIGEEQLFKAIDFCAKENRLYDCLEEQPDEDEFDYPDDDEGFNFNSRFFV